jgi:uncharacterized protein involved in outer membrane biogenesis
MFGLGFLFRLVGRMIAFVIKAVVFVAALATVAAGVMYAMFDAEAFKRELSQRVVDVTGRTLAIGSAELQMGLPPKVVLNDVRLSNARWGSRPDMARIKSVEIDLNPGSIVSGGSRIAQVRLDGADVLLETDPVGASNWQLAQVGPVAGPSAVAGALNALGALGAPSSVVISNTVLTIQSPGGTQVIPIDPPVQVGGGVIPPSGGGGSNPGGGNPPVCN